MSTMTVTSTINRKYLNNKTKQEVIDLALWILEVKCKIETDKIELHNALESVMYHLDIGMTLTHEGKIQIMDLLRKTNYEG